MKPLELELIESGTMPGRRETSMCGTINRTDESEPIKCWTISLAGRALYVEIDGYKSVCQLRLSDVAQAALDLLNEQLSKEAKR